MGKISERIVNRTVAPKVHWRDTSLFTAVVASVGTAGFMYAVVLPILNTSLNAKLEGLASKIEQLNKIESELGEYKEKVKTVEAELKEANKERAETRAENPFLDGSVYPNGLDKIKIGDAFSDVQKIYPNGEFDEYRSYYSTKHDHPIFSRATYYSDRSSKNPKVGHILYIMRYESPLTTEYLKEKIVAVYGNPQQTSSKNRAWWSKIPVVSVEISEQNLYKVMSKNRQPLWVK